MAKRVRKATKAKQEAQKFLANVPEEYVFWCCDGRVFKNMPELRDAFDTMTEATFASHSNKAKSDFSNWVRDVIGDEKLARELEGVPDRIMAAGYVATRIASLSKELV